jgi:glycosyltransferase involved in cell wall biosynthesis
MREILKKADKISVCSNTQKHLSVGELALAGRLTSKSFGYDFVDVVYPGILPKNEPSAVDNRSRIRAKVNINPQDYVVLWCGGYNAWTDVETLFRGLEIAMKANPRIHFLSVGASTYSNSETQYDLFQKLIHNSEQKENFHLLDWQPWREIYGYYQASDIGVNIDALHYETIYGTRTRLLEMIGAGLPVITSLGSEISYMLHEKKAAVVFEPKNNMSLGNHLISLSQNAEIGNTVKCNAALFAVNELSFQATTKSLRDWIKHPAYAPDKNKGSRNNKENLEFFLRTATRKFLWNIWGLWK